MRTDSELIAESLNQSTGFGQLYERHAKTIHRYAARRVGATEADDVMSETFLIAYQRRANFSLESESALPWLYGIATNLLHKHRRLEAAAWKTLAATHEPAVAPDVAQAIGSRLDAQIAVATLASAICRMPARDRDALLLYAWGDLDYEGVAEALGIPIGTVRSRLNRARRVLRAANDRNPLPEEEVHDGRVDSASQGA
ncbi:MAG TPA: RNA polymerase sigma factor [Galbitalea sp.]|nr:RNA polymerase sigma factor [Galbitalea sp.]